MIKFNIEKHATAFPSKVIGGHIINMVAQADTDNGAIVGKGDYVSLDLYKAASAGTFTATVLGKAANGNWYVEVEEAENAFLVYSLPLINEQYAKKFEKEENFFNGKGEVMRTYELKKYDVFEVSADAISGVIAPKAKITSVVANKMTIA